MSSKRFCSGSRWTKNKWAISVLTLLIALLLLPQTGNTKEKKSNNNRLPPAPDTGSPEEDFSAGGTRDNKPKNTLCGIDDQQIAYLLGNGNREFTSSAYPTFWFYIPHNKNEIAQTKFVITELETGKKIYNRTIQGTEATGMKGITLPKEKKNALSPGVNYAWSLEVECAETDRADKLVLEGWISRKLGNSKLQNQLATAGDIEKHTVYLQHNLLYDALTELAQLRVAKPGSIQIKTAWNQLLTELGWQELTQHRSATNPIFGDSGIIVQKK